MSNQLYPHIRRILLASIILVGIAAPVITQPLHQSIAARVADTPAPGTDLWHLDSAVGQYTQAANGLVDLHLYNSPVGNPFADNWHFRNVALQTAGTTGAMTPVDLPFGLRISQTSGGSSLAALTNEDGVTLGVGVQSINGAAPATVDGQPGDGAITYTDIISSPPATSPATFANLILRATISGLDASVILNGLNTNGQVVFAGVPQISERG